LYGEGGNDNIRGGDGNDTIDGGDNNDVIFGENGNDSILGGNDSGQDFLYGGADNDTITGGGGSDVLTGGPGRDELTGGSGFDGYDINASSESPVGPAVRDHIFCFNNVGWSAGDWIDLKDIDSNDQVAGKQTFVRSGFIGTANFSAPGQIRVNDVGSETLVQWNTDGDTAAEGEVLVADGAATAANWQPSDFLL
jgi:Ca2+-binding RTX toxin-like protein